MNVANVASYNLADIDQIKKLGLVELAWWSELTRTISKANKNYIDDNT